MSDYLGFFNFSRLFLLSPLMSRLLQGLLGGRNTYLLLNMFKAIIEMSKKRNTHTHTHTHTHTKLHSVRVAGVSPSCLLRMADFPLGEAFTFI